MTVAVHEAMAARSNQPGFGAEPLPPIAGGMSVSTRSLRGPETSHLSPSVRRAVAALLAFALEGSAEIAALNRSIASRTFGSLMMDLVSFRPPWGYPRYPARDGGAERLVLSPKRLLERGFFVRHDLDVEGEPQQRAVDDEAPIAHQHRLTPDDGYDRDEYWITHITVETGHHKIPGRRDGRRGAETLQRETRKCVNEPRHTCENHHRADAARQLQTKERRLELPTRDQPWNEPRQRTWGDHKENRRAQDGTGSLHRGSRHASLRAHSNLPFIASRRHPGPARARCARPRGSCRRPATRRARCSACHPCG